ncbi:uncharacterized protein LOC131855015 [Achroia grisella]|uniref:uncharacterized protein LOC131855015 n=1 Tax=Achroia grisella TaxID=688607 RepID=UPI0027D31EAD|nr:uncharacterized protein LOC131855015 [Achroia grisella]
MLGQRVILSAQWWKRWLTEISLSSLGKRPKSPGSRWKTVQSPTNSADVLRLCCGYNSFEGPGSGVILPFMGTGIWITRLHSCNPGTEAFLLMARRRSTGSAIPGLRSTTDRYQGIWNKHLHSLKYYIGDRFSYCIGIVQCEANSPPWVRCKKTSHLIPICRLKMPNTTSTNRSRQRRTRERHFAPYQTMIRGSQWGFHRDLISVRMRSQQKV